MSLTVREIDNHPDVVAATAELEWAQSQLKMSVYGDAPHIDSVEVLVAAQRCRNADNYRNRTIAKLVRG